MNDTLDFGGIATDVCGCEDTATPADIAHFYKFTGKLMKDIWQNRSSLIEDITLADDVDACVFVGCACETTGDGQAVSQINHCLQEKGLLSRKIMINMHHLFIGIGVALALLLIAVVPIVYFVSIRMKYKREKRRALRDWTQKLGNCVDRLVEMKVAWTWEKKHISKLLETERNLLFVFTDIENSTFLTSTNQKAYKEIQEAHDTIIRDALDEFYGFEVNTEGDSFQCAFQKASQAMLFCQTVQENLLKHPWSSNVTKLADLGKVVSTQKHSNQEIVIWHGPRVRMGVHAADGNDYEAKWCEVTGALLFSGRAFETASAVEGLAQGGQMLLTQSTVDRIREESGIFHMNMFHLGTFLLGKENITLFQAIPYRGSLSLRSFPQIALPQVDPARGLNITDPPDNDVCFVCMRVVGNKWFKQSSGKSKSFLEEMDEAKCDFWAEQPPALRHRLEPILRSWMQQFGGYEVCLSGEDCVLIVFKKPMAAVKFCMVTQITLMLMEWPNDLTSQPDMHTEYVLDKFIFKGPRIGMSILCSDRSGFSRRALGSDTPTRRVSYHFKSDNSKRRDSMDRSPAEYSKRESRFEEEGINMSARFAEQSSMRNWQHSSFIMKVARASPFLTGKVGKKIEVGDDITSYRAWHDYYPATSCSSYCGRVSPCEWADQKHLVLFFYFSDKTPGCTMEAKYFRDYHTFFTAAGAEVIGISLDGEETHEAQNAKFRLPYPLISDKPGGLNGIFGGPNLMTRATYVVSMTGKLIYKFESNMMSLTSPYVHVLSALTKVQEIHESTLLSNQVNYSGPDVEICKEACKIATGGEILFLQKSIHANSLDLWKLLPSNGGPARPCIVDMGTHELKETKSLVSIFGIIPAILASRFSSRRSLKESTAMLVRRGANDAPSPASKVAIVFTFISTGSSLNTSECGEMGLNQFRKIARQNLELYSGYESQEVGKGNFMMAFSNMLHAVSWCALVKLKFEQWLSQTEGSEDYSVQMGASFGRPTYGKAHSRTGRQDYFGPVVNMAARIAKRASAGQILVESGHLKAKPTFAGTLGQEIISVDIEDVGMMSFKGFKGERKIDEVLIIRGE